MAAPERHPRAAPGPGRRLGRAWRGSAPEERLAALAGLGLWLSMFLPWYGKSVTETVSGSLRAASYKLSAFGSFSFVEAAVLLVASSVLLLLFARAERRAFHLPGGDGSVILVAGVWTALLIFYRMLDKPHTTGNAQLTTTVGLQWGIVVAMAAAICLASAGTRMRAARRPEPARTEDPTLSARRPSGPADGAVPRPPGPARRPADGGPARDSTPEDPTTVTRTETETETAQLSLDVDAGKVEPSRRAPRRESDGVPEYDPFGKR